MDGRQRSSMYRSKWQARFEESQRVLETFSDHFCCDWPHGGPRSRTNIPNAPGVDDAPANVIGSGYERADGTSVNATGHNAGCQGDEFTQ